jgi:hypothetical protein
VLPPQLLDCYASSRIGQALAHKIKYSAARMKSMHRAGRFESKLHRAGIVLRRVTRNFKAAPLCK